MAQPQTRSYIETRSDIECAEAVMRERLGELVAAMLDLALGVVVQAMEKGEERIYTKPPDRQACEYLINRAMGKLPDRVDVSSDSGPVQFTVNMGEAVDRISSV